MGRYLKRTFGFTSDEYDQCIRSIISVLESDGILIRHTIRGADLLQIAAPCLVWQKGYGVVEPDDLYSMKVSGEQFDQIQTRQPNSYFSEFYQHEAYDLHTVEGREHTAQISYEQRIEREIAFIEGKLTCMFCSPTMELGVDISDLQLVHCRNVPPTPANYAQRSGRAGRGEDPAMVLTYCASGSAHDQFFFRHRDHLVAGVVRPPTIDLANEDLVKAHVHAMWLGILNRLARDPKKFARVCTKALERCHFNPETGEDLAPDSCPAACYECLLSYRNQPDYPLINRHDVVDLLSCAMKGYTERLFEGRTRQEQY